jgi:hypothetical protein
MPKRKRTYNSFFDIKPIEATDVIGYQNHEIGNPFIMKLKVPSYSERFNDDHRHYTKSNINVCYSAPRSENAPRNWYETQLTVSKYERLKPGYPLKGVSFYVVTDDGFGFMAHTTSDNNKQFAAVNDELILGKWIKTRLVDQGLVEPIIDTSKDVERKGMITAEMLNEYGCNAIAFQKTDLTIADPENLKNIYEVWTLKMVQIDSDDE